MTGVLGIIGGLLCWRVFPGGVPVAGATGAPAAGVTAAEEPA